MKEIILSVFFILFLQNSWATNYCLNDAKACYIFREGTGTTVADSSNNGNVGTFGSTGHPAWSNVVPSRNYTRWSALFNSDHISLGNSSSIQNLGAMSICFWVNPTNFSNAFGVLVGKSDPGITIGWSLFTRSTRSNIEFYRSFNAGNNGFQFGTGISSLTAGIWYHICFTHDGTTANPIVYINGSAVAGNLVQAASGTLDADSGNNAFMGYDGTGLFGLANLAEVAIWGRVLSSNEVSDIYNNGLGVPYISNIQGGSTIRGSTIN